MGMTPDENDQIIEAQVPMGEMARYSVELRSMTQGLGTYTIEMDRYDPVPDSIAKRIIEQAQQK